MKAKVVIGSLVADLVAGLPAKSTNYETIWRDTGTTRKL
jgi:hypothetical protein